MMSTSAKLKIKKMIQSGIISEQDGEKLIHQIEREIEVSHSNHLSPFQAVVLERPSHPDQLSIQRQEDREPQAGEVQILVKAFPVNFSDFLLIKGLYPMMPEYPFTPGVEVSGVVRKVGAGVTRVEVGEEVIGVMRLECGGQGSLVITDESLVVRKPPHLTHEEACGIPAAFLSMYLALEKAELKPGERVFISSAAGNNGQIAVQLAKLAGAEIYASASNEAKLDRLRNMGVDHVINHVEQNVVHSVLEQTNGHGVDVVINTTAGEAIQQGLNILAPEGRYVEIAVFGLQTSGGLNLSHLVDNQSFFSFNVKKFLTNHPERRISYLDKMAAFLEQGLIKPYIAKIFPFTEIHEAYSYKQNRNTIGRVIVRMPEVENISLRPARPADTFIDLTQPLFASGIHEFKEKGISSGTRNPDIAIVGMSGRFADANDISEFWSNLVNEKNSIVEIPFERWDNREHFDPDHQKWNKTSNNWGGFMHNVDRFDSLFFQISGREAEQMDPQQRLFLEESWRALEDSGYAIEGSERMNCGVFVGVAKGDYVNKMHEYGMHTEAQSFWGNECSVLAARISYHLNLRGPAVAIDTACSSSLTAIHLACQSLRYGECELAVAGGVFIYTTPGFLKVASSGGMLSPRGQCSTFDDNADGFVPGEAVGAVVLKPLEAAIRDRDQIYGVIKGTKINQDGKTNGITAPSVRAQTEVQSSLYQEFKVDPRTISYIEAHGTGTKLGDPIEVEALTNSFRKFTKESGFCAIGSVKTNIGHTAAAAGVTSLIKILQSMRYKQLPASLNYKNPNEHIDFENSPFYVNTKLQNWKSNGKVLRAAINSFGFSGTNAHIVIEDFPQIHTPTAQVPISNYLILISAKSVAVLLNKCIQLADWLEGEGRTASLSNIAYTLNARRSHFQERRAYVVNSRDELITRLREDQNNYSNLAPLPEDDGEELMRELLSIYGRAEAEEKKLLIQLANGYVAGTELDWSELYRNADVQVVSLPVYPFEGERYWVREVLSSEVQPSKMQTNILHPLIDRNNSTFYEQSYSTRLQKTATFLKDHQVGSNSIFAGACYVEMCRAAAEIAAERRVDSIQNVRWIKPLIVNDSLELHIRLLPQKDNVEFEIFTNAMGERILHCSGLILYESSSSAVKEDSCGITVNELVNLASLYLDSTEVYSLFEQRGFFYGPSFHSVKAIYMAHESGGIYSLLSFPDAALPSYSSFPNLHPSMLDGAFQGVIAFVNKERLPEGYFYLPTGFREAKLYRPITKDAVAHMTLIQEEKEYKCFDIYIYTHEGELAVKILKFTIELSPKIDSDSEIFKLLQELERGERSQEEIENALQRIMEV
ncbi:beta-ketoacyl synthase N-terminal-like domain-containing protein [Paenibacillus sp. FSL P4-0502]|uniref:beta-ketoacyl synthase N-terminal-like domain-containing protein n=1 Tax=Paenibacillus sp. FSL P4-0502 TaxID=2975319 RepID=UPI0030F69EB2